MAGRARPSPRLVDARHARSQRTLDARLAPGHDDERSSLSSHHHRLAHHPPGGRAAAARRGPLRRRHRAAGRVARGVRAEPASACADQKRRQDRGAGGAGRPRGADPGRSRQGDGARAAWCGTPTPACRSTRPGRSRCADGEVCYVGEPVAMVVADDRYIAEDAAALVDGGLRAPAVRRRRADREGCRADPPRALDQRHHHLQGRVRRRRRGLRQGRACVQAGAVAAPRRRAFDRGARPARRAARRPTAASRCTPRRRRRTICSRR